MKSGVREPGSWHISPKAMPVVQIDTEAGAAYVQVTSGEIAETRMIRDDEIVVTIDLSADGELIGIEVVGTKDFTLDTLLDYARIPRDFFDAARWHTRYVSA